MVEKLISFSLKNRALFCSFPPACLVGNLYVQENPIDAIPDLSENQVIVLQVWMGRSHR
jgi:Cu/Ag efflux pump CusA